MEPYSKTTWVNGDVISISRLNKIENQLELLTSAEQDTLHYNPQALSDKERQQVKENLGLFATNYDNYYHRTFCGKSSLYIEGALRMPLKSIKFLQPVATGLQYISINKYVEGNVLASGKDIYIGENFVIKDNKVTASLSDFQAHKFSFNTYDLPINTLLAITASTTADCVIKYIYEGLSEPVVINKQEGRNDYYAVIEARPDLQIWLDSDLQGDIPVTLQDFQIIWGTMQNGAPTKHIFDLQYHTLDDIEYLVSNQPQLLVFRDQDDNILTDIEVECYLDPNYIINKLISRIAALEAKGGESVGI